MRALALIPVALLLAACEPEATGRSAGALPPVPADIVACLSQSGITLPRRALTVEEVERFWKTDRRTIVAMRLCGKRLVTWYSSVRQAWR